MSKAFPYDRQWAENVFKQFWTVYPRAGNLLGVFAQLVLEDGFLIYPAQIRDFLIESIRYKDTQRIWEEFKSCAKYPQRWDKKREMEFLKKLEKKYYTIVNEKQQFHLELGK